MRRQYHSRNTERGVLIWDVHRLVELTRGLPVADVSLADIRELDESFWFDPDNPTDVPTCRAVAEHAKLMGEVDLNHPIILSADGRVMDGMHRVCRAWTLGHATVRAVRFDADPEPDHVDVALEDLPYDEPA
ncbi:MAG: hypothetical protein AAF333_02590 [Planctomycetota bacterium]